MKVVISGYYGYGNLGDELILKSIINELKTENSKYDIVVLSGNPKETEALHRVEPLRNPALIETLNKSGIKAIHRYNLLKVFKAILKTDVLISGGGGLLQDVTSKRSLKYYLAIILLAKILGKKVIVYSQGIGPINSKLNIFLIKLILNKVDEITVRDEESKGLLKSFGIKKDISVVLDPVMRKIMGTVPDKKDSPHYFNKVGIVVRDTTNSEVSKIIANVSDWVVKEKKLDVIFIPFQKNSDLKIIDDIRKQMKEKSEVFDVKNPQLWIDETLKEISSLKLLVGMRLHSIILAVKLNVPFVAISYDPKVDSFLKSINYDRKINLDGLNVEKLVAEIDNKIINSVQRSPSVVRTTL